MNLPNAITIARSTVDDFTPSDQVDFIQDSLVKELDKLFTQAIDTKMWNETNESTISEVTTTVCFQAVKKTNLSSLTVGNPATSPLINLDDLRFYDRILSQAQITDLYSGNIYYNLPTTLTKYNNDPSNTTYQFEVVDEPQKIISHY